MLYVLLLICCREHIKSPSFNCAIRFRVWEGWRGGLSLTSKEILLLYSLRFPFLHIKKDKLWCRAVKLHINALTPFSKSSAPSSSEEPKVILDDSCVLLYDRGRDCSTINRGRHRCLITSSELHGSSALCSRLLLRKRPNDADSMRQSSIINVWIDRCGDKGFTGVWSIDISSLRAWVLETFATNDVSSLKSTDFYLSARWGSVSRSMPVGFFCCCCLFVFDYLAHHKPDLSRLKDPYYRHFSDSRIIN